MLQVRVLWFTTHGLYCQSVANALAHRSGIKMTDNLTIAHLCFGDSVSGEFDHGEVALADGPLDVVKSNPDSSFSNPLPVCHAGHIFICRTSHGLSVALHLVII